MRVGLLSPPAACGDSIGATSLCGTSESDGSLLEELCFRMAGVARILLAGLHEAEVFNLGDLFNYSKEYGGAHL